MARVLASEKTRNELKKMMAGATAWLDQQRAWCARRRG